MERRLYVTLLGHKDHGKSTLIGRLLVDTGSVKADRVEEVKAICAASGNPFDYAFLLDSFREEREEGMTIDVIHAQLKGRDHFYDCIDVPGHRELVKNMLTGASHADAGVLIVSAWEGIEEQTGHHLRLARFLGLDQLVVAVNKMDRVEWESKAFADLVQRIRDLFGHGASDRVHFIPVSAREGDNVVHRSQHLSWYSGPTLWEAMEALKPAPSFDRLPLRLPVQSLYPGSDGQTLVVGRIASGTLKVGDRIAFAPGGTVVTVRAIHGARTQAESALAGENVGLSLDPGPEGIVRGEVGCPPQAVAPATREIHAPAIFLEAPDRDALTCECGTASSACEVVPETPIVLGEVSNVTLRLERPVVAERSRTSIGRMAIKRQGRIIGVAAVP